ncbi:DUF559 domain-containing protein [Nocardioides sp. AX2bis]|uniref:DUF559 domain-containing protein n=1 Tax=Nocardioides sp. AX2bis TaxID=2653157 RepID=UPI0012F06426|nr:DUF559 domain-containing protein [Nocardioides sp. AX2bis]VXB66445.1 conserved hypothetical protein [Nocardioides sp. AX2bis]
MDVVEVLAELGGVATRAQLRGRCDDHQLLAAREAGLVVRLSRGRYVLPGVAQAPRLAHAAGAVLSHRSAAAQHGWGVAVVPPRPDVVVPQNRRVDAAVRRTVTLHRGWLEGEVVDVGGIRTTSVDRTITDCLRALPFNEALAIADSALRAGVTHRRMVQLASATKGPGSMQARRVAEQASIKAANPFESVLRAIALGVEGLSVRPQSELWSGAVFLGRPDLVDHHLKIVLEADSFTWHGNRTALAHDCRRYDEMVAAGWLVLRFAYEQVMGDPGWVAEVLTRSVLLRSNGLAATG